MPSLVSDLLIRIGAKNNASEALDDVRDSADKTFGEKGLGKIANVGAAAVVGVGTAVVGVVAGLGALAKSVSSTGDQFQKMSLRTGLSSESLSTLAFAAERSGTSIGSLENGLRRLSSNADDASRGVGESKDAFKSLGVEVTDANGNLKSSETLLFDLANKFRGLKDDTRAAALAQDIFGKSGTELLPLLKEGANGIQTLQSRARELGLEFSTEAANDSAVFQDALTDLSSSFTGIKNMVGVAVIPIFTSLATTITQGVITVQNFIRGVGGLPQMFDDAVTVVTEFAKSYAQHIIRLFTDTEYLTTFLSNLGNIFVSALKLVGNFTLNLGNLIANIASPVWVPLKEAGLAIWDVIKLGAQTGFNAIIETIEAPINRMIEIVNSVGSAFGVSIEKIDFTPITVTAPKSIEDRWQTTKNEIATRLGDVEDNFETMKNTVVSDAEGLKKSVVKAWEDTEMGSNPKIAAIAEKYKNVMEDEETGPAAVTKAVGDTAGTELATATGAAVERNKDKLLPAKETLGSLVKTRFENAFESGINDLISGKGSFTGFIKNLGGSILGTIQSEISGGIASSVTNAIFGGGGGGGGGGGAGLLGSVFDRAGKESGTSFLGSFKNPLSGFFGGESPAGSFLGLIGSAVPAAGLVALGVEFGDDIVKGIGQAAGAVKDFFSGAPTTVNEEIAGLGGPSNLQNLPLSELERLEKMARDQGQDHLLQLILDAKNLVLNDPRKRRPVESTPVDSDAVAATHDAEAQQWAPYVVSQVQNRFSSAVQPGGRLQGLTFGEMQAAAALMGENGVATAKDLLLSNGIDVNNAIEQFMMHVANTARIPTFQIGGVVPGPPGQPRMVMAEGGEEFIPRGRGFVGGGMRGNTTYLFFNVTLRTPDVDNTRALIEGEFGDMILDRVFRESERNAPVLFNTGVSNPQVT